MYFPAPICYTDNVIKLLEQAVEKVSHLPQERQDELAEMPIVAADGDLYPYTLSTHERAAVAEGLSQVDAGKFASGTDVTALWKRFGL